MKIISRGKVIELGDTPPTKVRSGLTKDISTSFLDEFYRKLNEKGIHIEECMRAYCLNKIYQNIKGRYDSYLEILGGVGVTAKIFEDTGVKMYLNDLDDACAELLKLNFPEAEVSQEDMFKFPFRQEGYDCIFMDYNNFTLHKFGTIYNKLTAELFEHSKKYVIINDCSPFYLRCGKKSYEVYSKILGKTVTNIDEFFHALREYYGRQFPGWSLTSVNYFYASSYLVFTKIPYDLAPILYTQKHLSSEMRLNPVLELRNGIVEVIDNAIQRDPSADPVHI